MSEIKIIVDIGGQASSLKDVIGDLEKLRDTTEEIRAKKGKLIEAKGSEDVAKLTAEIESLRSKYEKLTAEKVKAKQGTSELDKAIQKLKFTQSEEGKELAKVKKEIKEQIALHKTEEGLLGKIEKRRKALQFALGSEKTVEGIKKINQELFKLNLEQQKLENVGKKAFNSWGNALESFQFKFNALGNVVGGFIANFASDVVLKFLTDYALKLGETAKEMFGLNEATIKNEMAADGSIIKNKELRDIYNEQLKVIRDLKLEYDVITGKTTEFSSAFQKNFLDERARVRQLEKERDERLIALNEFGASEGRRAEIAIEKEQIIKDTEAAITKIQEQGILERRNMTIKEGKRLSALVKSGNAPEVKVAKEIEDKKIDLTKQTNAQITKDQNEEFRLTEENMRKGDEKIQDIIDESNKKKIEKLDDYYDETVKRDEQNTEDQKKIQEDLLKAKEKQLEEEADLRERFAQAAFDGLQERNERELQQNADKLSELDRQLAYQHELALKGEVNTLQEVEKARAEALAEKAAMEKKAANLAKGEKAAEIFLEFYKAYANEKEGAFMKALTATAKGKGGEAVVKALFSGSFYDGTEDTGKGGNIDAKGGFGAILHPHERILTRAHNEAIGDISNEEVVRRVNLFEDMPIADKSMDIQVNESLNRALHSELKRIAKAVENPAYIDIQRNYINELVSIEQRLGAKIETTHKRIRNSYSRD